MRFQRLKTKLSISDKLKLYRTPFYVPAWPPVYVPNVSNINICTIPNFNNINICTVSNLTI